MVEQKVLEWYEYDELQQHVDVLISKIRSCEFDLKSFPLSAVSRNAIEQEIVLLNGFLDDLEEL